MGYTLKEVAQTLKDSPKKVQMIYAFNGTGKTRLSREFKNLVSPKVTDSEDEQKIKILYYNAYTEDLFYWDNDLLEDLDRKLMIRPNNFTNMALGFLKDQDLDNNIATNFQHYTNAKITPIFSNDFSEVSFAYTAGDDDSSNNIKISKGEESNFIWCVFYSLLEEIVETLNEPDLTNRTTDIFNKLEYVFIDDPVSSLDDSHLIELAINIANLIKSSSFDRSKGRGLKYIITTHNPLFYNVLFNEFNNADHIFDYKRKDSVRKRLDKNADGTFQLINQQNDSPFSYHLYIFKELKEAIETGNIKKYHFNFLRNIFEKTSTFLGYKKWENLLSDVDKEKYYSRIINLSSHSKHHGTETSHVLDDDKEALRILVNLLIDKYNFNHIESST